MAEKTKPGQAKNARPQVTEEQVRAALSGVYDPELGASLVDLNMVRKIEIKDGRVKVGLVLTAPGCPLGALIMYGAQQAVAALPGVSEATVELLDEPYQQPEEQDWDDWLSRAFGHGR